MNEPSDEDETPLCDGPYCETMSTETVAVSVSSPHDGRRHYCPNCYNVYLVGVQHGRYHEAALHGQEPGRDSSQDLPSKASQ